MERLTKLQRKVVVFLAAVCMSMAVIPTADAMHIMEGYLPPAYCVLWGVICVPFLAAGFMKIKNTVNTNRRALTLLAVSGAFVFIVSSLKIPSVTGSCSHMTGTGLSAILFGVSTTSVLGIIVLIFQAILLAHGGLTTLGANCFSMAIAGPLVSWLIYKGLGKTKLNRKVTIFLAATVGDLFTYCVTAFEMALAHHSDSGIGVALVKFLAVFAPTQVPLAIIEGILTVVIILALESLAARELKSIGYQEA
ncbi:MAG: energy-coupling factor ABC transporter permease [Lachnospiraceae bacterium]|nr:energy-coupling factor ABC transporter permease [Lachnospiraceae bacterium]